MRANIILAESAGFCFGVSRSVKIVEDELEKGECYCLGELIHNKSVMESLAKKGLKTINSASEAQVGTKVVVRAHGVSESEILTINERGASLVDATCPYVSKIHKLARAAENDGATVLLLGQSEHPEVRGICGWCEDTIVFSNAENLKEKLENRQEICTKSCVMLAQTTQTRANMTECEKIVKKECTNAKIFDTICSATSTRQSDAIKIAKNSDAMVVIGDKHSANSVHLAKLCRENCENTQFIESKGELDIERLLNCKNIGLTAGASAPQWIIKEVLETMSDEIKVQTEETVITEQVMEPATTVETCEEELSFDQMLENSFKTISNGEKVSGIIVAITPTEISVDLGTKYSGFINTTEFDGDDLGVSIGDSIETIVVRVNDVEGTAQLSKRRLDSIKFWADIEAAQESGEPVEGVVTEENKGGVVVSVKGIRIFVPASQTGLAKDVPMAELLKQKVRVKITEVNRGRKRVVGSIRAVGQKERRERAEAVWSEIDLGKQYTGTVKSLTSYGAFVDIGGVDGMVHVTELSWGRVRQPSDVVSVGDKLEVFVIGFDKEARRISLGCKREEDNPWAKFKAEYAEGSVTEVKIVKLMPFGAFAEVMPGVDGLIHISQIADRRIGKPDEVLAVGDVVNAKITAIDDDKQKISLSIRAAAEPVVPVEDDATVESGEDSLVYEVSAQGEATGNAPEAE